MVNGNQSIPPIRVTTPVSAENIVQRLASRIRDAKKMGFRVRSEWLGDQQATYCEIGGVKTLFVDLSQTAAEQFDQLEESLAQFATENEPSTRHAA